MAVGKARWFPYKPLPGDDVYLPIEPIHLTPEQAEEIERFHSPHNKTFEAVERWKWEQIKNLPTKFPVYTGPSQDLQSIILNYQSAPQDEGIILTLYTTAGTTASNNVAETSDKPLENTLQNGNVPSVSEGKGNGWIWIVVITIALIFVIMLIKKR